MKFACISYTLFTTLSKLSMDILIFHHRIAIPTKSSKIAISLFVCKIMPKFSKAIKYDFLLLINRGLYLSALR